MNPKIWPILLLAIGAVLLYLYMSKKTTASTTTATGTGTTATTTGAVTTGNTAATSSPAVSTSSDSDLTFVLE